MSLRYENENKIDMATNKKLEKLPEWVSEWNIIMKASRKTASTRREFVSIILDFLTSIDAENIKNIKPSDINSGNVDKYYVSIQSKKDKNGKIVPTSDSYQICVWSCFNNLFNFMIDRGYIEKNYIRSIEKPKNQDLDRIKCNRVQLSANDFKKVIEAVNNSEDTIERIRDKAILLTFMTTGMRETALINIEMSDVNMEERTLTVIDKGTKIHQYVIDDVLYDALKEWIEYRWAYNKDIFEDNHLFLTYKKTPMSPTSVTKVVKKYTASALGKPLSPHKLRAGYATILYNKTHNLEFVRRAIGHSNISTTQRYVVTKGEERKQAADIINNIF